MAPGSINGAITIRTEEHEYPIIVVNVTDIDAALERVVAAGGKVVQSKRPVGEMGLYARVVDTEGNLLGVWQTLST
jgi:uncharacterized protein